MTLIEWPDRLGGILPDVYCRVQFSVEDSRRKALMTWQDSRLDDWVNSYEAGMT